VGCDIAPQYEVRRQIVLTLVRYLLFKVPDSLFDLKRGDLVFAKEHGDHHCPDRADVVM
jgi:hypothetical protein